MSETVPDPATRDAEIARDALSAHAEHLRVLADAEENPYTQLGLQDAARRADQAASGYHEAARTFPPPLPDEPPDGAICLGHDRVPWQRRDDWALGYDQHWYRIDAYTYEEAVAAGMDPKRRMIELPDPDNKNAMLGLRGRAALYHGNTADPTAWVTAVVRALAERGQA